VREPWRAALLRAARLANERAARTWLGGGPLAEDRRVAFSKGSSRVTSLEREPSRVRRLLEVWQVLVSELDEQVLLDRVLEAAREITGARYAAVTILNDERTQLLRLLTSDVGGAAHRSIEDLADGRAAPHAPIAWPPPLSVADAALHRHPHWRPDEHATTRSFLGAPLLIRGEVWGNLHLIEKVEGEFTEADEAGAAVLARWASIAIENARLYGASDGRRQEAERVGPGLVSRPPRLVVARRRGNPMCPGGMR
jgi:two-component system, NarL family, sensor histidine kinase DevS